MRGDERLEPHAVLVNLSECRVGCEIEPIKRRSQAPRTKALLPKNSAGFNRAENIYRDTAHIEDSAGGVTHVH
jgi:hypothetical protein